MRIVVLVGLPGSGKSTWLERQGVSALSSDAMRRLLADNETDQTVNAAVFAAVRYLLRERLVLRRPVSYVDATNLRPEERRPYIEIGREFGCTVEAVFFDVPLEVCLARNAARSRAVPLEAMHLLASRLVRPAIEEGFAAIEVIAQKQFDQPAMGSRL